MWYQIGIAHERIEKKAVNSVRRAACCISGTAFHWDVIYTSWDIQFAGKTMTDSSYPLCSCFKYLQSGGHLRIPATRTKYFSDSFVANLIALINRWMWQSYRTPVSITDFCFKSMWLFIIHLLHNQSSTDIISFPIHCCKQQQSTCLYRFNEWNLILSYLELQHLVLCIKLTAYTLKFIINTVLCNT